MYESPTTVVNNIHAHQNDFVKVAAGLHRTTHKRPVHCCGKWKLTSAIIKSKCTFYRTLSELFCLPICSIWRGGSDKCKIGESSKRQWSSLEVALKWSASGRRDTEERLGRLWEVGSKERQERSFTCCHVWWCRNQKFKTQCGLTKCVETTDRYEFHCVI
jgi:hypothetical protein